VVNIRLVTLLLLAVVSASGFDLRADESAATGRRKVYVLPIRDEFNTQMVYLVRRGVKEAIEAKAELLVLDMDTNGGSVSALLEIIDSIGRFKG